MSAATPDHVSRAGDKLAGVLDRLPVNFKGKTIVDVGASTGGFTQVALDGGAARVYAVERGTKQLHPSLSKHVRIVSLEKTNILDVKLPQLADVAVVDVSFTSLRPLLVPISRLLKPHGQLVVLLKPQFEAKAFYPQALNRGVIKNKTWRRKIIKDFEAWVMDKFLIQAKVDSDIPGVHGNLERFYLLSPKG